MAVLAPVLVDRHGRPGSIGGDGRRAPTGGSLRGAIKKTSLYIEPEVDEALGRRADAEGISKAELIRRSLRSVANGAPRPRLVGIGSIKGAPSDISESIDHYLAITGFGED